MILVGGSDAFMIKLAPDQTSNLSTAFNGTDLTLTDNTDLTGFTTSTNTSYSISDAPTFVGFELSLKGYTLNPAKFFGLD